MSRGMQAWMVIAMLAMGSCLAADEAAEPAPTKSVVRPSAKDADSSAAKASKPAADEDVVLSPDETAVPALPAEAGEMIEMPADEACMHQMRACCNPCPRWPDYLTFDVLFLQRDNATDGQPIAIGSDISQNPGETLLTTKSMNFATAPGVRLFYGRRGPEASPMSPGTAIMSGSATAASANIP